MVNLSMILLSLSTIKIIVLTKGVFWLTYGLTMKICYPMELADAPVHVPALWLTAAGLGEPWAEEQMLCAALTPSRGHGRMRKPARNGPERAVDDSLNPKYPKALFKTAREWNLSLKRKKKRWHLLFKYLSSFYNYALNSSIGNSIGTYWRFEENSSKILLQIPNSFSDTQISPTNLTGGHHLHLDIVPMFHCHLTGLQEAAPVLCRYEWEW